MRTSPKRSRRRSSRPIAHNATRGVLLRTTGPSGMFQVALELIGLFAKGGEAVLAEQEKEGHARDSCQLGSQTGGQLTGLVELQGKEEARLGFELLRVLLQCPEDFRWIGD